MQDSPLDFKGELSWTARDVSGGGIQAQLLPADPYRVYVFFANRDFSEVLVHPLKSPTNNAGVNLRSLVGTLEFHFRDVGPLVGEEWWVLANSGGYDLYVISASFRPMVESCD